MIGAAQTILRDGATRKSEISMGTAIDERRSLPVVAAEDDHGLAKQGAPDRPFAKLVRAAGNIPVAPKHAEVLAADESIWRIVSLLNSPLPKGRRAV